MKNPIRGLRFAVGSQPLPLSWASSLEDPADCRSGRFTSVLRHGVE